MAAKYDAIGLNYAELRRPDPRIAAAIDEALGAAETVLNVGAGSGAYEPADRQVTAVEPSIEMIRKRNTPAAKVVQAWAKDLPFEDGAFDAAMAILTLHHWNDKEAGLRDMRRVTRGPIVLLTFYASVRPWLTDYIPELAMLYEAQMPAMSDYERWLGLVEITPMLVPHDCSDGFSMPIGGGPPHISTRISAPAVRHSGTSGMSPRVCEGWSAISSRANGSDAMLRCLPSTPMMRNID